MDSGTFINACRGLVLQYVIGQDEYKYKVLGPEDIYVVWSTKVLHHNKALLSTPISDGLYFEVTYNGVENEYYFDVYSKDVNIRIDSEGNEHVEF